MPKKIFNRKYQKNFRKDLRKGLSPAEATLWTTLQKKQIEGEDYDKDRDEYLIGLGLKVIRFENDEIWNDLEGVLDEIKSQFKR